ncbi:MAG: hypothetical protein WCO51_13235 [bacterium]
MIQEYVSNLADKMGMKLSQISLVDGNQLGCLDIYLLKISIKVHKVDALIFKTDIENLENGKVSDRMEVRTRSALNRLQVMLDQIN